MPAPGHARSAAATRGISRPVGRPVKQETACAEILEATLKALDRRTGDGKRQAAELLASIGERGLSAADIEVMALGLFMRLEDASQEAVAAGEDPTAACRAQLGVLEVLRKLKKDQGGGGQRVPGGTALIVNGTVVVGDQSVQVAVMGSGPQDLGDDLPVA